MILTGIGSFVYHASSTKEGQVADWVGGGWVSGSVCLARALACLHVSALFPHPFLPLALPVTCVTVKW